MKTHPPLIEYHYTLVPKGFDMSTASDKRMECLFREYSTEYANHSKAKRELINDDAIDAYALREHWELIRLDVEYANPPWESWADFESKLSQLDNVLFVDGETIEGLYTVFVSVSGDNEEQVADEITEYFPLLNPIIRANNITVCPEAPLMEIEQVFRRNQQTK